MSKDVDKVPTAHMYLYKLSRNVLYECDVYKYSQSGMIPRGACDGNRHVCGYGNA